MASDAVERLRRILVIVPWIQANPGTPVEEIAMIFNVDERELREDLDSLGYTGLPGYCGGQLVEVTYHGDRVTIRLADFFSRPLDLSLRESVATLLAGRAVLSESPGLGPEAPLSTAVEKLESRLSGIQDSVPVILAELEAQGEGEVAAANAGDVLARVRRGVSERRVMSLTYHSASKDEVTTREVEPWRLRMANGAWYLQGHCRRAAAQRTFRVDRIVDVTVTTAPAPKPPEVVPMSTYRPEKGDIEVNIEVSPDHAWVTELVVLSAMERTHDGWHAMTFHTPSEVWAEALVLRLGPAVRKVHPRRIAVGAARRAREILARHDQYPAMTSATPPSDSRSPHRHRQGPN